MLDRAGVLLVGPDAVFDKSFERKPDGTGWREQAGATVAVEIGEIGQRQTGFDHDLLGRAQVVLARRVDVEHQDHWRRRQKFEPNVETDFNDHGRPAGGGRAEDTARGENKKPDFALRSPTWVIPRLAQRAE